MTETEQYHVRMAGIGLLALLALLKTAVLTALLFAPTFSIWAGAANMLAILFGAAAVMLGYCAAILGTWLTVGSLISRLTPKD